MIRIMIKNIEWDTDSESVELPTEHELCCEGVIADDLSDLYGWLVKSFSVEIINDDGGKKYYTLASAIETGVDYYEDEDGILQRVDERIDENGKDIS